MVLKIFFPQCCNRADSGLLVGRWLSGRDSAVVLAVIHYPFIPGQVKQYIQQIQARSGVELSVLGSWSLPKEGQEGMESFLRDLSTIFPQKRWLQINRELGKTGFNCQVLSRDQNGRRKVMLSQLHPIENGLSDPTTDPASELRQMFRSVALSQPLYFLDRYDDGPLKSTHWQSEGREASNHRGAAETLHPAALRADSLAAQHLDLDLVFSLSPLRFLSSKLSTCVAAQLQDGAHEDAQLAEAPPLDTRSSSGRRTWWCRCCWTWLSACC
ncbi:hypothetical protein KUCAC02_007643 [Chaenocephalus aceratus]|uniref:Uncharacterized protein n=1 Tax=Chaenocephalus aceratus TaxID=36190 RepID=A0ACB9X666_CHAAC|nr:hypothetical protein KUCAC02_007643 [Chaenocephalus aceratus]